MAMRSTGVGGVSDALDRFRLRVSRSDAVLELSLLGLISGITAGLVSILFRLLVEQTQAIFLDGSPGNYESLKLWARVAAPTGGAVLIGVLFYISPMAARSVGVAHVMERLAYYQGHFPVWNAVVQFLGGALALITGHSVGREGPGVHLGAAASNLPAQRLGLPNNSLRVLAACGTSAAIAASFNTPLAGVAFALEVLMFEYTVAAFAPVLLAAVSATILSRAVFGPDLAFSVPDLALGSLWELPYVLLMGLLIGALSAAFIRLLQLFIQLGQNIPVILRCALAGLAIGLIGLMLPQVMGIGYDTVNRIILGEVTLVLLVATIGLKLLASTVAVGFGIPGGLIGPALVVGAATGGAFATLAQGWGLADTSPAGFYVLLGMGAMMAGTLQAPLAGLIAIVELTGNHNIIFPGMLTVIAATLMSGHLHGREPMYLVLLRALGRDFRNDPVAQSLRQIGVGAVMDRNFVELPRRVERKRLATQLAEKPRWILVRQERRPDFLLAAVDVARTLREEPESRSFDLRTVPGTRLQATGIDMQATLEEARRLMHESGAEVLYVTRVIAPGIAHVYGVLDKDDIESSYR